MKVKQRQELLSALETSFGTEINNFFADELVTEIYINADGYLRINSLDRGAINTGTVIDAIKRDTIIKLIAGMGGKTINKEIPELAVDINSLNCRCQLVIPPLVPAPIIVMRKLPEKIFTLEDYLNNGTINQREYDYLINCITNKKNILLVGSTGTGKTTFLNALIAKISEISPNDRLGILEDTPELKCSSDDFYTLRTKVSRDPQKSIDMDYLLYISMRLSPKRLIVGEIRDKSALSLIKAWNTGHPGGLSTTHADDALSGLDRVEMLAREAIPTGDFKESIAKTVNVVVAITLTVENNQVKRKISEILEIKGFDNVKKDYIYEKFI